MKMNSHAMLMLAIAAAVSLNTAAMASRPVAAAGILGSLFGVTRLRVKRRTFMITGGRRRAETRLGVVCLAESWFRLGAHRAPTSVQNELRRRSLRRR